MSTTLVFATHNPNKLKEVQALMPADIKLKSLTEIGCIEEILEDAKTIAGNALIKARFVKENYGYDCFADDTGLEVAALNGEPGVYSARYAGMQKDATDNMNKLLREMQDKQDRNAHFKTVIALIKDEQEFTFTGICEGIITTTQMGDAGFGYDPIFLPSGYAQTFAQMSQAEKGQISHRGKAINKLISFLNAH